MDSDRIYFRAASQIVRFALHEWLGDKFIKRLELAQAIKEVKKVSHAP